MSTIVLDAVSRWYGNVVAVNDVSMRIGPGVTGLLGPNGAGKSSLIHLMGGFLAPSSGSVTLDGDPVWRNTEVYRRIGIVTEREAMYDLVTGWQFLLANARLHGLPDPVAAARRVLDTVEMTEHRDREIRTYSKGMKQRIRIATALVHEPSVLFLDEPFNGMDPRQRLHLIELLRALGEQGSTVLFSSHILEEVEEVADGIEVMVAGRHAATGDYREIRRLMTERPHQYWIRSDADRRLAAAVMAEASVAGVRLVDPGDDRGRARDAARSVGVRTAQPGLHVDASDFAAFVRVLPDLARRHDIRLLEVTPSDESLESVFSYLVAS